MKPHIKKKLTLASGEKLFALKEAIRTLPKSVKALTARRVKVKKVGPKK